MPQQEFQSLKSFTLMLFIQINCFISQWQALNQQLLKQQKSKKNKQLQQKITELEKSQYTDIEAFFSSLSMNIDCVLENRIQQHSKDFKQFHHKTQYVISLFYLDSDFI